MRTVPCHSNRRNNKGEYNGIMIGPLPLVASKRRALLAVLPARTMKNICVLSSRASRYLPASPTFSAPTAFSLPRAGRAVQVAAAVAVDLFPRLLHLSMELSNFSFLL